MQESSLFSIPSPAFVIFRPFSDGHSDWCKMVLHCIFDLHFSNSDVEQLHVPTGHLYVFFREMSIKVLCPFFDWVVFLLLSCMSCLYILEIKPLSVASFANIVSHSLGSPFCLWFPLL